MPVNRDKPHLWKQDTLASVDHYNKWFMKFAPKAFRETRVKQTQIVEQAILDSNDLLGLSPKLLRSYPNLLPTLRMSCCPPLAVDRLVGLANSSKSLVASMEENKLAVKMAGPILTEHLARIVKVVRQLLDPDIFLWISEKREPTQDERHRAATIVSDRLTGAVANPIIRNAQEKRQLAEIKAYLIKKGYKREPHPPGMPLASMKPGTFCIHYSVLTGTAVHKVNVSVDAMIQPHTLRPDGLPILVEAKSAGDFTNTNKRRKEEAKKYSQLKAMFGENLCYLVFLCGYFDAGYLGYEAQDGIDWAWEHRISDFEQFGI
ncbi:MAG TPA: XamI family restriction endonuclease [Pirellulales bacterium]|jgi:type II restriction enzyme|nr:XamI family restriction endonuclease [Pirellulales bacterium]